MLRHLLRGTLGYTGMDVAEPFFGWHVPYISAEDRSKMMDDYAAHLSRVDTLPVLEFPSMSDFSKDLRPLR
jgi:NAD(P)H dehydrogenase (quinone)